MTDVTTLAVSGDSRQRVDLVFVAEGYTLEERSKFLTDARNVSNYFFSSANKSLADPFVTYASFFNVSAVFVASKESGYSTETVKVDTAFGATSRLSDGRLIYGDASAVRNAVDAVLPSYAHEMIVTLINTTKYGGAGGAVAWVSAGSSASYEVALHEIGHSFAGLEDEYTYGAAVDAPKPDLSSSFNVSTTSDPSAVPWKEWLGYQDSLGTVGVYEGGYYRPAGVWRPTENSKMKSQGYAFSAPQKEAFIHQFYKSIGQYAALQTDSPLALRVLTPDNSLFAYRWTIEGKLVGGAGDTLDFGAYLRGKADGAINSSVTLVVSDKTGMIRRAEVVAEASETLSYVISGVKLTLDARTADYASSQTDSIFLFANSLANKLRISGQPSKESYVEGGRGNDLLGSSAGDVYFDGGIGVDTVRFSAKRAEATITSNADGTFAISSKLDGVDRLVNVEYAQFADETVALAVNTAPIRNNFDGDGKSDILLQNMRDGSCYVWTLDGFKLTDYGFVGWTAGLDWTARATGDFNNDGRSDILLQNRTNGDCYVWGMNGKALADHGYVGWRPGADWQVATTGDFNGDGKADILLQNVRDGSCYVWGMNGRTLVDHGYVGWTPGPDWAARTTGDFNGDGKSDILLQNRRDGSCYVWNMDGKTVKDYGYVGWTPGADWSVRGAGDFNGDGKSDILLQNRTDGSCYVWNMDGRTVMDYGFVGWTPGPDWVAIGVNDFNGDDKADILLQNASNGDCYIWEVDGRTLTGFGYAGWTPGADWHATA